MLHWPIRAEPIAVDAELSFTDGFQDLFDALQSGHLGGAAIDTLKVEPMEEDCILMGAKNCIMTPHIAWAPVETRVRLMNIVADNIRAFLNGTPQNRIV